MYRFATLTSLFALLVACGDKDSPEDSSGGGQEGGIGLDTDGEDDDDGGAEGAGEDGGGDGGGDDDDDDNADGDDDDDDGTPKFDVGSPDGGATCGSGGDGMGLGDATFSYIWISNSSEGTLTKLNTQTLAEEGRYAARDDLAGSNSRTSVALSGNAAVANRNGGVAKFFAQVEDCVDLNGDGVITTSSGPDDVKAWAEEECRAWYTPLDYTSNRPLAWAQGTFNESTCSWVDEKLWTAGRNYTVMGNAEVLLLDGETGAVEQTVAIPEVTSSIGLYGGAVDGDGNFWGVQNSGLLVRVDRQDFTYELWTPPSGTPNYGIAVDAQGRPWLCGGGHAIRFDPVAEAWQATPSASSGIGGCMTDGQGTLYHSRYGNAGGGAMVAIDTETVMQVAEYAIPNYVHGVSIDFDGFVWGVAFGGSDAYRLDVSNGNVDTYAGLVGAYTYSDMTGFGLSSAGTPSG